MVIGWLRSDGKIRLLILMKYWARSWVKGLFGDRFSERFCKRIDGRLS